MRAEAIHRRFLCNGLAVRHRMKLGIQAVALYRESAVGRDKALQRDRLDALIQLLKAARRKTRQKDHHALTHAQA